MHGKMLDLSGLRLCTLRAHTPRICSGGNSGERAFAETASCPHGTDGKTHHTHLLRILFQGLCPRKTSQTDPYSSGTALPVPQQWEQGHCAPHWLCKEGNPIAQNTDLGGAVRPPAYILSRPPLAANSHSSSVGSLFPAHVQKAQASFQLTCNTGWSSLFLMPDSGPEG